VCTSHERSKKRTQSLSAIMSYTFGEAASVYRRDATTQTEDCNVGTSQPKDSTSIAEPENYNMVALVVETLCGMRQFKPCVKDTVKGTDEPKINKEPEINQVPKIDSVEATSQRRKRWRWKDTCCKGPGEPKIDVSEPVPKNDKEPEIDDDDTVTVMHSGPSAESGNMKRGACCKGSVEQRAPKRRRTEY
jgi:hypothetical protein